MASINRQRLAADIGGDFVVFLIGMRINTLWKIHKWLPVFSAMPKGGQGFNDLSISR